MATYDAIFVGSGHNSLVGAANLAMAGWRVAVLERNDYVGGAIRTAEFGAPGYLHEHFSCFHPLFVASEAYAELADELHRRGLEYLNTDLSLATVHPDGSSIFLSTSHEANHAEFESHAGGDGAAWTRTVEEFNANSELIFGLQAVEPTSMKSLRTLFAAARRRGLPSLMETAAGLLEPARPWLTRTFEAPAVRGLMAPWPLHQGYGPEDAGSAFSAQLLIWANEVAGSPVPRGGGSKLVEILRDLIVEHGGELHTEVDVAEVLVEGGKARGVRAADGSTFSAGRATICSVTPGQLYGRLLPGELVPEEIERRVRRFRYGPGDFRLWFSLDQLPQWQGDQRLLETPYVTLSAGIDAVSRAVNEARCGMLPAEPTVGVGQPMTMDLSRAPDGGWVLWVEVLGVPSSPAGDAAGEIDTAGGWSEAVTEAFADRVQARIAAHVSNLGEALVERVAWSPLDLERQNINLVGGQHAAGAMEVDQLYLGRPFAGLPSYKTPVPQLWMIGASTRPGAGLNAASGWNVSKELLNPGPIARLRRR